MIRAAVAGARAAIAGPRAIVLAMLVAAGCAAAPPPVDLSGTWPARAGDYRDETARWSRRAVLRGHFQQTLDVTATFRSPAWRAAAAAHDARLRGADVAAAVEAARTADTGDLEFALVVTTYDRAENDLDRGERSSWKLALVDEAGVETPPSSIVRDKRPPEVIRAELPAFGDFSTAYVARFPRTAAILGPAVSSFTLRMWNARGGVALVWKSPTAR